MSTPVGKNAPDNVFCVLVGEIFQLCCPDWGSLVCVLSNFK